MTRSLAKLICLFISVLTFSGRVAAQDAVPQEIMERTFLIRWGNSAGTAFTIDYQGRLYVVTAKHVVSGDPPTAEGVPLRDAVLQIKHNDQWVDLKTIRTLYSASKDADIAVFETDQRTLVPYEIQPAGEDGGVTFGQQVWFIGYPFGLGTDLSGRLLPFLKRGTMSALDKSNPNAVVFYIDGFNNHGFSGGPIIFWDFKLHRYFILGVVHGFRPENAETDVNGQRVATKVLVNSGILVGYSIEHAMAAIRASLPPQQR